MTNREWLLNKIQNMSDEELAVILACESRMCEIMDKGCAGGDCSNCIYPWLQLEHKEPITLSEAERIILENIDKEYKWICRDEDNYLRLFNEEPKKDIKGNVWVAKIIHKNSDILLDAFNHLFQFITWEDEQPYNIEEILKGE